MFKNIFESIKRRSIFIRTSKELSRLSDKELNDIGIHRGMIHDIARDHAYGELV